MIQKVTRMDVHLRDSNLLKQYMTYKDWTIRELADLVGVSKTTIGDLRTGERSYCNPRVAKKIAKALDVPVEVLFLTKPSTVSRETCRPSKKKAA